MRLNRACFHLFPVGSCSFQERLLSTELKIQQLHLYAAEVQARRQIPISLSKRLIARAAGSALGLIACMQQRCNAANIMGLEVSWYHAGACAFLHDRQMLRSRDVLLTFSSYSAMARLDSFQLA